MQKTNSNSPSEDWQISDSENLYAINEWGAGYFNISKRGEVQVTVQNNQPSNSGSLLKIVEGMKERGLEMPCILRIENVLDHRIKELNEAFHRAISAVQYQGEYRGVFPIKVNQQCHVIEEIADFGQRFNHGLEAGSKAELIIALSQLRDHNSLIICNGYKDAEFVDLGL